MQSQKVRQSKKITKHFNSLDKAEYYQLKLCELYHSVVLVESPKFSEEGKYVWQVSE